MLLWMFSRTFGNYLTTIPCTLYCHDLRNISLSDSMVSSPSLGLTLRLLPSPPGSGPAAMPASASAAATVRGPCCPCRGSAFGLAAGTAAADAAAAAGVAAAAAAADGTAGAVSAVREFEFQIASSCAGEGTMPSAQFMRNLIVFDVLGGVGVDEDEDDELISITSSSIRCCW